MWKWAHLNSLNSFIWKILQSTDILQTCCFVSLQASSASCYTKLQIHVWPCCKERTGQVSEASHRSTVFRLKELDLDHRGLPRKVISPSIPSFICCLSSEVKVQQHSWWSSESVVGLWVQKGRTNLAVLYTMFEGGGRLLHGDEVRAAGLWGRTEWRVIAQRGICICCEVCDWFWGVTSGPRLANRLRMFLSDICSRTATGGILAMVAGRRVTSAFMSLSSSSSCLRTRLNKFMITIMKVWVNLRFENYHEDQITPGKTHYFVVSAAWTCSCLNLFYLLLPS